MPAGCQGSAGSRSSLGLGNRVLPRVDPRFTRQRLHRCMPMPFVPQCVSREGMTERSNCVSAPMSSSMHEKRRLAIPRVKRLARCNEAAEPMTDS